MACSFAGRLLRIQSGTDASCQLVGWSLGPEMRENKRRLLADHVVVQGYHMDSCLAQGPQHPLDLRSGHDEIAVYAGSSLPENAAQVVRPIERDEGTMHRVTGEGQGLPG